MTDIPEDPKIFRLQIELVRTKNPHSSEGFPWHWELRYNAGPPLGYISIGKITTDAVTAREAIKEMLINMMQKQKVDEIDVRP